MYINLEITAIAMNSTKVPGTLARAHEHMYIFN